MSTTDDMSAASRGSALSEGLGPLPAYAHEFRPRWPGDDGGFTGAQMRAYALQERAAERERVRRVLLDMQASCTTHNYYAYALVALGLRA
jgi:hypothetical protein